MLKTVGSCKKRSRFASIHRSSLFFFCSQNNKGNNRFAKFVTILYSETSLVKEVGSQVKNDLNFWMEDNSSLTNAVLDLNFELN